MSDKMLKEKPAQTLAILDSLEKDCNLNDDERLHVTWNRVLAYYALSMSLADVDDLPEAIEHYRTSLYIFN